ncbi:DUF6185 family protein [Streptomyces sp. NPDC048288]|uniref:DUF6185 family protein n=1 Tax=Streptomyces sp. NPDC048288 TaxID=3365529 RepID=UPI00371A20D1
MTSVRWLRLLPLVILALTWWACAPAEARENNNDDCQEGQLDTSKVNAKISFRQHHKNFIQVSSEMKIEIPAPKWEMANQLTFSEESAGYQKAMHCLLRGPDNNLRFTEWRQKNPVAVADGDKVAVTYNSIAWIRDRRSYMLGPWKIARSREKGDKWIVFLQPSTLKNAHWKVEAELDDLEFEHYGQTASADNTKVTWADQRPAQLCSKHEHRCLALDLPWKRSIVLSWDQSLWKPAGIATWWMFASGVLALTALRARRMYTSPAFRRTETRWRLSDFGAGRALAGPVLQWALLSGAVALTLLQLNRQKTVGLPWHIICIAAGLTLILVARPWHARADEPGCFAGHRRRQARAVIGFASAMAAIGMLVILGHRLFGLPWSLAMPVAPLSGRVGYVLIGVATVWLWLAAMTAWAWRFAREGGLVPIGWTRVWNEAPVLCVAAVSTLLLVIVGGFFWCLLWAAGNQWERVTWLIELNSSAKHDEYVNKYLLNFSFYDLTWIFTYSWLLTGVALLALLHSHFVTQRALASRKMENIPLGPEKSDLLIIAVLFSLTVGMRGAKFASNNAQYGVWLVLNIISLFAIIAAGRRWSVLSRMGYLFRMHKPGVDRMGELMEKAHQYRNLNHQLQLLDQGRLSGVTCDQLEGELRELRQWLVSRCLAKNPPNQISILDVALAWGPEVHWWFNARRAALLAFCFGIPASFGLLYLESTDLYDGLQLTLEPTAIPNLIAGFIAYQLAWGGVGFTLGALWRQLPGRRSATRAWSVTLAYAMPALLLGLLTRYADSNVSVLLLYSVLTLFILTLTGLWMDTTTLKEERQYWPSRFALLLSIHRLRGLSGQIAWLLAQIAAVAAILKTLIKP